MKHDLNFFVTTMPITRPATYYLGCMEGSIFMDFDHDEKNCIRLKRISFDGYDCCELKGYVVPMNEPDSNSFKEMIHQQLIDQLLLTAIVKRTIADNKAILWEDALTEYELS